MAVADRAGLGLAAHTARAAPHEGTLAQPTLDARFAADLPERLIGDRAYDSDPLDAVLVDQGVQMIAPHHRNGTAPRTWDGHPLRRWRVERLFAWPGHFRLVVRYERHVQTLLRFVHLACIFILRGPT